MTALTHDDPQILDAIEKLQHKMAVVSDSLEATRTPSERRALKKTKNQKSGNKTKGGATRFIRYLLLFIALMGLSYVLAQITSISLEQNIEEAQQSQDMSPAEPVLPARFMLKTAQYEMIESELGPSLEITIFIENTGGQQGTPKRLEIELVDAQNASLLRWPMNLSADPIPAGATQSFITRLIEPPAGFANIRVSMPK